MIAGVVKGLGFRSQRTFAGQTGRFFGLVGLFGLRVQGFGFRVVDPELQAAFQRFFELLRLSAQAAENAALKRAV